MGAKEGARFGTCKCALMTVGASIRCTSAAHSSFTNLGSFLRISAIVTPSSVSPVRFSHTPATIVTNGF